MHEPLLNPSQAKIFREEMRNAYEKAGFQVLPIDLTRSSNVIIIDIKFKEVDVDSDFYDHS